MSRIIIFGRPGSGKSTLSISLSNFLDIPVYHLDRYYFRKNWTVSDKKEFLAWQQETVDQDEWILDGNNLDSLELRYSQSDVAIFINRSKWLCYWRIIKRRFLGNKDSYDRPVDCPEKIAWVLLTFIWKFDLMIAKYLPELREKYPEVLFIEVKSEVDIRSVFEITKQNAATRKNLTH